MRFYKGKQAEMLHMVTFFLKENRQKLGSRVPAMKDFIDKYIEMEKQVYAMQTGGMGAVEVSTLQKQSTRKAFVKVVAKMIAVLHAAGLKTKGKPLPAMDYSLSDLNRLTADKLMQTYLSLFAALKKVRNLQYYGVNESDLLDMQAYYKEFAAIKNAPAIKKKERARSNKQINDGVTSCIRYLEKHIDRMMLLAAEDDPQMQADYKAGRKVLPRASGRPSDKEVAYRESRGRKKGSE